MRLLDLHDASPTTVRLPLRIGQAKPGSLSCKAQFSSVCLESSRASPYLPGEFRYRWFETTLRVAGRKRCGPRSKPRTWVFSQTREVTIPLDKKKLLFRFRISVDGAACSATTCMPTFVWWMDAIGAGGSRACFARTPSTDRRCSRCSRIKSRSALPVQRARHPLSSPRVPIVSPCTAAHVALRPSRILHGPAGSVRRAS